MNSLAALCVPLFPLCTRVATGGRLRDVTIAAVSSPAFSRRAAHMRPTLPPAPG